MSNLKLTTRVGMGLVGGLIVAPVIAGATASAEPVVGVDPPQPGASDPASGGHFDKIPDNFFHKVPDSFINKIPDNFFHKVPDSLINKLPDNFFKAPDA